MDWTNTEQWNNKSKQPRISDHVEMMQLTNKWTTGRMVGKAVTIAGHWLTVRPGKNSDKKGDSGGGKPVRFFKPCHGAYIADDGSTQVDASKCPYCKDLENFPRMEAYVNLIARSEQENEPRRRGKPTRYEKKLRKTLHGKGYYKEDKDTEAWTPVRMLRVTTSLGKKISEIASLNTRKTEEGKKSFGPEHPKFGFDLMLKYDEKAASPGDMYSAQKGELTKLSAEEQELLLWEVKNEITETLAEATKEAKQIKPRLCDNKGVLLFPELSEGSEKKSKKDSHGRYRDQFDEDDEDDDDDDEDDADDDTDDDEGEDDRRSKKKSKAKKSKKSSKSKRRDDDEDDEDEDFDEGVDDDDEEDEDEDDDDEEEERRRRLKLKKKKKLLAELAAKKAKKSKGKKSKSKRRDDDDDDDEVPF